MKQPIDGKDLLILQLIYSGTPSMHELRKAILARSVGTIAARLKRLEEKGLVTKQAPRQARSRRITKEGEKLLSMSGLLHKVERVSV
jgi:DNA-binding HxlR family transcriptional regulator